MKLVITIQLQRTITLMVLLFSAITASLLGGCSENKTSVSITGYNHMEDLSIGVFYINGVMGPRASANGGGGAETCCVSIPKVWRPGLAVKIILEYDGPNADSIPPSPAGEIFVPIPEYKVASRLQVHFYKGSIKIVVSPCSPRHPFYPMSKDELAPWKASSSKQSMVEAAQRGGGSLEC